MLSAQPHDVRIRRKPAPCFPLPPGFSPSSLSLSSKFFKEPSDRLIPAHRTLTPPHPPPQTFQSLHFFYISAPIQTLAELGAPKRGLFTCVITLSGLRQRRKGGKGELEGAKRIPCGLSGMKSTDWERILLPHLPFLFRKKCSLFPLMAAVSSPPLLLLFLLPVVLIHTFG